MKYDLLPQSEEALASPRKNQHEVLESNKSSWWKYAFLLLLAVNVALTGGIFFSPGFQKLKTPNDSWISYTGVGDTIMQYRNLWYTRYSAESEDQLAAAEQAWDAVRADHGLVAIPYEHAKQRNLPSSLILPTDRSKRVYILESYHMIHCLQLTRKSVYQLKNGEPLTYDFHHVDHCLDALRQHVMCNADDHLLYIPGNGTAGHGQTRQCRDWNYLRSWATENTACFKDITTTAGLFGQCDDGGDGLIVDS